MAVCFEPMNSIVVLDDDDEEEERPQPSSSSSQPSTNPITPPRAQIPAPTHITQSPFASAKKESHVLQAENQRLFTEFVEHCSNHTKDHPEVMTFLHAKHAKASPDFLASVEFRNTLGRCLTRAQANRSKTFVYINELCTVLKQRTAKRRQTLAKAKLKASSVKKEQPSTSGQPEEKHKQDEGKEKVDEDKEKNTKKASRRQIAYLENLLKVYNDEIRRLQEKELSLDDLMADDSGYIQEHKLKGKMMKIYDKLCELKGCNTLTGRVIEQRISYSGTRYPEINKKIERFINSPEAQLNPPDYSDILQQVQRANERHSLSLSRKQLVQIAQMAFQETGNRLQERRHLDMVYNFGSHLTDPYKPATDPAMRDSTLKNKLRSNREAALSSLEQVINKYALQQDDTEEEERKKRLEKKAQKANEKKDGEEAEMEVPAGAEGSAVREGSAEGEELPEEEEEDDDDEDVSSDPDIEEEIQASTAQAGPEDDEEEEDNTVPVNENKQNGVREPSSQDAGALQLKKEGDQPETNVASPVSAPGFSPLMEDPSPTDSPSQSEPMELDEGNKSANRNAEDAISSNHKSIVSVSTGVDTSDRSPPLLANHVSLPPSPEPLLTKKETSQLICETRSANCSPRPPSPIATRKRKRSHQKESTRKSQNGIQTYANESEVDITLDSGVANSPLQADSTRADTPQQEVVTSSQSTPPPKKNKVNVATQCDPDEIIVLSDSEGP
ncbi:death domain-associated protein 6 [Osmerus mordax]|uniref:death domain-associated protein 6 n=1 Tax=Osmerus mordax TaxID=8014 RepID=UPI00350F581E